jgi:hypothetical protein
LVKKFVNTLAIIYVLALNSWTDIPNAYKFGMNIGNYTRIGTTLTICISYVFIYYKNEQKLKNYFEQKSKEFYFIEENKKDEEVKLKKTSEIFESENMVNLSTINMAGESEY